jgi:hypothetical protein
MREIIKVELPPADGLAVYDARLTNQDGSYRLVVRVDYQLLSGFSGNETCAYFFAEYDADAISLYGRAPPQSW